MFSNESDIKVTAKRLFRLFIYLLTYLFIYLKERVQYKPSYGLTSFELVNLLFVGLHVVLLGVNRPIKIEEKQMGKKRAYR